MPPGVWESTGLFDHQSESRAAQRPILSGFDSRRSNLQYQGARDWLTRLAYEPTLRARRDSQHHLKRHFLLPA